MVPWVETAEQLRDAVRFARYPTEGVRGLGAERATAWGQAMAEHAAEANEHVFVVPIVETVRAKENLPAMLSVPGVDLFWFGPADYSATAGHRGQWEGPGVAADILCMKDAIRAAGKWCGLVATSDANVQERLAAEFNAIALGMDARLVAPLATGIAGRRRPRPSHQSRPHVMVCRHFFGDSERRAQPDRQNRPVGKAVPDIHFNGTSKNRWHPVG